MAVDAYGPDAWLITFPGFNRNPNDYEYKPFQMSYEFATFLFRWDQGDYGPSEFHTRNFRIAQRRSCYPTQLMNRLGVFTEEGEKVVAKAKSYLAQIRRHYEALGSGVSSIPTWDQCYQMDQIALALQLESKHITFLKTIYNKMFPEGDVPTQFGATLPDETNFKFRTHNGKLYMMTNALRDYSERRKDFEVLVKFGLVALDILPKPFETHGRGRAPVGAFLTENGKRFFEDFHVRYDPQVKKQIELHRMMNE